MATHLPRPDRFEELRFLGGGGAGQVYLVRDRQRNEEVALKVVRTTDPELMVAEENGARLQQELSLVAPQVPKVYDFGKDQGAFFVVMEYVEGEDLSRVIHRQALGEERAIRIAIQLCDFLNRLHTYSTEIGGRKILGVVHGDIKPDNIRLLEDDRIRVLDFGIARQLSLSRPVTRILFGSLPYIPPERLERGELDSRSDLWAVGVVLYALISGRLPFAGSTQEEVAARLRLGELRPLPESCSRPLSWVVYKSLSFDPGRRYLTTAALQTDLEAVRDGRLEAEKLPEMEPVTTRPERGPGLRPAGPPAPRPEGTERSRPTGRVVRSKPPQETRRTVPADSPPRPTRKRRPIAALVLILSLLMAMASQLYVRSEAEELRRDLLTGASPDIDLAWQRYTQLVRWAPFGLGDVDQEMAQELRKAADRILASYSGDDPRTTQEDWERAREYLAKVIDLGGDSETQARLVYSRGHLALAEAKSLRQKGDLEGARRKREEAAAQFQEAANLDPAWPDPYLGLARIHVYEDFNYDRLQQALGDAGRRGYAERRRTTAFRADGHLNEGQRLYSESIKVRGRDGEEELLEQALSHFNEALRLYAEIPGYANVGRIQANTARRKQEVENRLEALADNHGYGYGEVHDETDSEAANLDPALMEDGWP